MDGEIESLGGGEAVGLFGDVPAERLGVPVLDDHEEGDVAVLNGRDHRRVRAPHHAGRVGGDASVVVVDRPLRAAVRREQSILAHEAQHPVPADAEAIEGAQAGPDLAVPLAGEGRAIEVAADRLEQPRIVDHRPRPSSWDLLQGLALEPAQDFVAALDSDIKRLLGRLLTCESRFYLFSPDIAQLDHIAEAKPPRVLGRLFVD